MIFFFWAQTQSPTITNYAVKFPTFGENTGVSTSGVQGISLSLGKPPSRSWYLPCQVSIGVLCCYIKCLPLFLWVSIHQFSMHRSMNSLQLREWWYSNFIISFLLFNSNRFYKVYSHLLERINIDSSTLYYLRKFLFFETTKF